MHGNYDGQKIGDDVVRLLEQLTMTLIGDGENPPEDVDQIESRFDSLSREELRLLVNDFMDLAMDLSACWVSESGSLDGPLRAIREGGWRGWVTTAQLGTS